MSESHGGDGAGFQVGSRLAPQSLGSSIRRVSVGKHSGADTLWNMQYSVDEQTGLLRAEAPVGAAMNVSITYEKGENAGTVSNNVEMINTLEAGGFAMDTKEMPAKETAPEGERQSAVQELVAKGAKKKEPFPVMVLDKEDGSLMSLGDWRDAENKAAESKSEYKSPVSSPALLMTAEGGQYLMENGMGSHAGLMVAVAQMTGQEPGAKR